MDLQPALEQVFGRVPEGTLTQLPGQASTRRYYRLTVTDTRGDEPERLIVMRLPPDALASDEKAAAPTSELAFLNVQRMLQGRGLPVPRIFAHDVPRSVVLLEDLGETTLLQRLQVTDEGGWPALYAGATDLLADLHGRCAAPDQDCLAYTRGFDRELLRWELDHFRKWGLEAQGLTLSTVERDQVDDRFDWLTDRVLALPRGFVHRDYQSTNLLLHGPLDRLVIIDFQDALMGPAPYDLVALLCDSYVELTPELQSQMIDRYLERRHITGPGADLFREGFWLVTAQRKLKDAGRFVYIDQVRGNVDFLKWFPQTMRYVSQALARVPELEPVAQILSARMEGYPDHVSVPAARTGICKA